MHTGGDRAVPVLHITVSAEEQDQLESWSAARRDPAFPVNNINSLNTDQLEQPDALGFAIGQYVITFEPL